MSLPANGRPGPIPRVPKWITLEKAGSDWWKWAWRTPQAAAWSSGDTAIIARRASLEDDLATLADVEGLSLYDIKDDQQLQETKRIVARLAALCTGRLAILKEMREVDDRLGLTPKAMSGMHWVIRAEEEPEALVVADDDLDDEIRELYAVPDVAG